MEDILNALLFFLLFCAGVGLFYAALVYEHAARDWRKQLQARRNASEAGRLILVADSKLLVNDLAAAEALYVRALSLSGDGNPFLASKAHYGLARVAMKRGNYASAALALQSALSLAPQWREWKPNFEKLLEGHLAEVRARLARP